MVTAPSSSSGQLRTDPFTIEAGNYRARWVTGDIAAVPDPGVPVARIGADGFTDVTLIANSAQTTDIVVALTDVAGFVAWRFDSGAGGDDGKNLNAESFSLRRLP